MRVRENVTSNQRDKWNTDPYARSADTEWIKDLQTVQITDFCDPSCILFIKYSIHYSPFKSHIFGKLIITTISVNTN